MTPDEFRSYGHRLIDWIADYRDRLADRPVMARTAPGEVKGLLPPAPPERPEGFEGVFRDLERTAPGEVGVVAVQPGGRLDPCRLRDANVCNLSHKSRASSSMSIRARPDRNDPGICDSPQNAPANWPQIAPVVSASSPRLTARSTASSKVSAL